MMINNNYDKTGQVELSPRQVNHYFKNVLMVSLSFLYGRLGFEVRTLYSRPYIHSVFFFCSGVARGCKRLVHTFRLLNLKT